MQTRSTDIHVCAPRDSAEYTVRQVSMPRPYIGLLSVSVTFLYRKLLNIFDFHAVGDGVDLMSQYASYHYFRK